MQEDNQYIAHALFKLPHAQTAVAFRRPKLTKHEEESTMQSVFNIELGSSVQRGRIVDIKVENVADKFGNKYDKLFLSVEINHAMTLCIDDALVLGHGNNRKLMGLWVKPDFQGKIHSNSAVGRLMHRCGARTIGELKDKTVTLCQKDNGFTTLLLD